MDGGASNNTDDDGDLPQSADEEEARDTVTTIDYAYPDRSSVDQGNFTQTGLRQRKKPADGHDESDEPNNNEEYTSMDNHARRKHISRFISEVSLTQRSLAKDTFSFLISSHLCPCSGTTFLAIFVFILQLSIFGLVCADVIDPSNKGNPFNIPSNVDWPVRITELLAIAVAIITQDDLRKAVNLLRDGYDHEVFSAAFGYATRSKWALSVFMRGSEGLLGLFVTFLLIMQSDTVLDLLLNFSAMEFVSLIDDVVFKLSCEGFFGTNTTLEAKALKVATYHVVGPDSRRRKPFLTAGYFIFLFAAMMTGWGIIWSQQASGKYMCQHIFAQFDDDLEAQLGPLSGLYTLGSSSAFTGRMNYINDHGMIGYCQSEKMWTLTVPGDGSQGQQPCNDWFASSSESFAFDVIETKASRWYAAAQSGRVMPLEHTYLQCYDCKYDDQFCGKQGICVKNMCECIEGWHGLRCEFADPCTSIQIDPRSEEGFVANRIFASTYHMLAGVELYHRPVYTSRLQDSREVNSIDIMIFTGRRWIIFNVGSMQDLVGMELSEETNHSETITNYLGSSFNGLRPNYKVAFISEAIDVDSRTDASSTPLGLTWHPALPGVNGDVQHPDLSRNVDVFMLCSVCNNFTNACQYGAACLADQTCGECPHASTGVLCQIPPTRNGRCDPYFNTQDFEYDGGDCCESSCLSTDEVSCGKDETGYNDKGYFHCLAEEADHWSGINGAARSGTSVALSGEILVVGDPAASSVRLFDKDGSEWNQRGKILEGPANSQFGLVTALSRESANVKKNLLSSPSATLVVGAPGAAFVRIYRCMTNGCIQIGEDIISQSSHRRFGASLSLIGKGDMVAIGSREKNGGEVEVFLITNDGWERHSTLSASVPWRRGLATGSYQIFGYHISLSKNDEDLYLALGTIDALTTTNPSCDADLTTQVYKWSTIYPPVTRPPVFNTETNAPTTGPPSTTKPTIDRTPFPAPLVPASTFPTPFPTESTITSDSPTLTYIHDWLTWGESISKTHYCEDESGLEQKLVALSGNAKVLAIGYFNAVEVYSWDATKLNWSPRKVDSGITESTGLTGLTIDLSNDGAILAIRTSINQPEYKGASVQVYKWNNTHYSPFFNRFPAGERGDIALSSDGMSLAVGRLFNGRQGGTTDVYKFQPSSRCGDDLELLRLSFTTDANPGETAWTLHIGSSKTYESQSFNNMPFTTFVEEHCVAKDECIMFVVHDIAGDGMKTPGQFAIFLEGKEMIRGGQFDGVDVVKLGNCDWFQ